MAVSLHNTATQKAAWEGELRFSIASLIPMSVNAAAARSACASELCANHTG